MTDFEEELRSLLNRYSKENGSDTPDFVLAAFLINCLSAFNLAVTGRRWHRNGPPPIATEGGTDD